MLDAIDKVLINHNYIKKNKNESISLFDGWQYEGNIFWNSLIFHKVGYGYIDIGLVEPLRRLFWVRLKMICTNQSILVSTAHFTWQVISVDVDVSLIFLNKFFV